MVFRQAMSFLVIGILMSIATNPGFCQTPASEDASTMTTAETEFALKVSDRLDAGMRDGNYSGGATALLACLIVQGTKMPLLDYARAKLFSPLGIEDVEWVTGNDGVEAAASGLRMRPVDLAKIGQLVLDRGVHDGTQLIPETWIDASFQSRAEVDGDLDYGYH